MDNSDKYINMNTVETLKDISGEREDSLIDQIYGKCTTINNKLQYMHL